MISLSTPRSRKSPHACGVDDDAPPQVPNVVPSMGHFNQALLDHFWRAPKDVSVACCIEAAKTRQIPTAKLPFDNFQRMTAETFQETMVRLIGEFAEFIRYLLYRVRTPHAVDGVSENIQGQLASKDADVHRSRLCLRGRCDVACIVLSRSEKWQ